MKDISIKNDIKSENTSNSKIFWYLGIILLAITHIIFNFKSFDDILIFIGEIVGLWIVVFLVSLVFFTIIEFFYKKFDENNYVWSQIFFGISIVFIIWTIKGVFN